MEKNSALTSMADYRVDPAYEEPFLNCNQKRRVSPRNLSVPHSLQSAALPAPRPHHNPRHLRSLRHRQGNPPVVSQHRVPCKST